MTLWDLLDKYLGFLSVVFIGAAIFWIGAAISEIGSKDE